MITQRRIGFATLLLSLFLHGPTYGQLTIQPLVGVEWETNDNQEDYLSKNWKPGFVFGLSGDYSITRTISVSSTIHYSYYRFSHYGSFVTSIPEESLVGATGESSHSLRLWIEGKFLTNDPSPVALGLTTGVGWMAERYGTIEAIWSYNGNESVRVTRFPDKDYFFHTIGAITQMQFGKTIGAELGARVLTNYSDRFHLLTTIGISYVVSTKENF